MMRAGIPAMLLATAAVLGVTAGCGSASSSSVAGGAASGSAASATAASTAGATTRVSAGVPAAAGVATPQQVVTGFIQTELAGHWSKLCSYLTPGKRSGCSSDAGSLSGKPTGKLTVDGAVVKGKRALVKVTGHICLSGKTECQGNTNPEAGMPTGSETFLQAYDKAVTGNVFSPVPCIKVNGKWYLNGSG